MVYIAFDIDGTLYDCSPIVAKAFEEGIDEFLLQYPTLNLSKPSTDEIMNLVGVPVNDIFALLFPNISQELLNKLNDYCTEKLVNLVLHRKGVLLNGVKETIAMLFQKGYGLLTASNGRKEYIKAVLDAYGLTQYFINIMTLEDCKVSNKTELLAYYKRTLSNCEIIIMVGDRKNDMTAALENGLPFIACAFGHNSTEIAQCKWIVHSFYDIPKIVEIICQNYTCKA